MQPNAIDRRASDAVLSRFPCIRKPGEDNHSLGIVPPRHKSFWAGGQRLVAGALVANPKDIYEATWHGAGGAVDK